MLNSSCRMSTFAYRIHDWALLNVANCHGYILKRCLLFRLAVKVSIHDVTRRVVVVLKKIKKDIANLFNFVLSSDENYQEQYQRRRKFKQCINYFNELDIEFKMRFRSNKSVLLILEEIREELQFFTNRAWITRIQRKRAKCRNQKNRTLITSAVGILTSNISIPFKKRKLSKQEDSLGNNKKHKQYKRQESITSKISHYIYITRLKN